MSEPVWNKFLTERDKAVFAAGGFGARAGFGKRPALLIIDVNWAFCGERPEPILDSIKRWRTSCGEEAWIALDYIKPLIDKAHLKGLPVIYTTGEGRPDKWDRGSWSWKSSCANETGGAAPSGANAPPIDGTRSSPRSRRAPRTSSSGSRSRPASSAAVSPPF
jgi:maleamate amidohydrolase